MSEQEARRLGSRPPPVVADGPDGHSALLGRYLDQATWHQRRALAALARAQELGVGGHATDQAREFRLYALEEAVKAYRLLQHVHQEAISLSEAAQVQRRLTKIYALAESIERELFEPALS